MEADHHSTARLHECSARPSFALCHCSNEHVIRLALRQSVRCLVHRTCAILAASVGGTGVRNVLAVLVSPDMSSCPA